MNVFFIRGLSTHAHDHGKLKFLDFGPVYQHIARGLSKRGIDFYPVTGLGSDTIAQIADRAHTFLIHHPIWKEPESRVHIFGHSAGGLVARLVLERLRQEGRANKLTSVLTLATPHGGSRLAEICADMPDSHPGSTFILRTGGYNILAKKHFFEDLTAKSVNQLFAHEGRNVDHVQTGSIVCWAPRKKWCLPLRIIHQLPAFNAFNLESDGIVERDTQPFGQIIAEVGLDHFRQAGFFGDNKTFTQTLAVAADFFKSTQNQS